MLTALGTLPFIATLWLLVVLAAAVLEESGAKIAAALKGVPPRQPTITRLRIRAHPRLMMPARARPRLHAAA